MINNRQGGRRRGRGGQRTPNVGGQPGNRQDNRQRGNAAQLLEKYKSMARDAQLGGDRVQAEYYLQFAEHYFRVLGENRPRFEDQRRQRDGSDEDEGDEDSIEASDDSDRSDDRDDRPQRSERPERKERVARPDRGDRPRRGQRDERGDDQTPEHANGAARSANGEGIPLEALPPAIGREAGLDGDDEAPRPKRRARRSAPAADDGEAASLA